MPVIGLTGGIGSGKSTVARLLADRGAVVIDADQVVRDLYRRGQPVHAAVVERFGPEAVRPDGELDRRALAGLVFADPAALADLESLTHPAVAAAMDERVAAESGPGRVVVLVVPLLVESGRHRTDATVVVDCPEATAIRRLAEGRGMTETDARARMARQASREQRLARADHVIDNSGSLADLEAGVDQAWAWMGAVPERR